MEATAEFSTMGRRIQFPATIPTDKFYGLKDSLHLQLKAANYMETLSKTVFREKKDELRKQLKEIAEGVEVKSKS